MLTSQGCNIFFLEHFQECVRGGGGDGQGTESTRHQQPGNKMSKHSFSKFNEDINLRQVKGSGGHSGEIFLSHFKKLEKQ
jgi:hypothetical protein